MRFIFFALIIIHTFAQAGALEVDYKHFVIVVPSYNNIEWAEKNLNSLCLQDYPRDKFHIFYVNDCSTDGTGEFVERYIKKHKLQDLATLINNTWNQGQMANRYRVIHELPDDAIVLECDGDDWYKTKDVLQRFNRWYQDENVWSLCTKHNFFSPGSGNGRIWPPAGCTEYNFACSRIQQNPKLTAPMIRSFYAGLFKSIPLYDLMYEGQFHPVVTDPAYMFPIMEMCRERYHVKHNVLYVRNRANPKNVTHVWSQKYREKIKKHILDKSQYKPCSSVSHNALPSYQKSIDVYYMQNSIDQNTMGSDWIGSCYDMHSIKNVHQDDLTNFVLLVRGNIDATVCKENYNEMCDKLVQTQADVFVFSAAAGGFDQAFSINVDDTIFATKKALSDADTFLMIAHKTKLTSVIDAIERNSDQELLLLCYR
jgi:glycosyltransferase involved in cell wall biosynthesis